MRVLYIFWAVLGVSQASLARTSYEGHQVLSATPQTKEDLELLRVWLLGDMGLDFWEEPNLVGQSSVFMAPPGVLAEIKSIMIHRNIPFEIINENVQRKLDVMWEELDQTVSLKSAAGDKTFNYDDWNTYEDMMEELDQLAADCNVTGLLCSVFSIGDSYEGRPIKMIKISGGEGEKKAYWIDSAIHAREWLAPATVMKVANHLIRNYGINSDATNMVDKYDWYILPVMNPDGFVYSRINRYWRKNRRPSDYGCYGADLNRNFNFRWAQDGVSHNPCSDLYCGSEGASEPETQAVQNMIQEVKDDVLALVTVHSYGQMWMFPWGTTRGWYCDRADDHADMMAVADATADAIERTYNTVWARGNSCEVIYATSGGTDDYAKGAAGIKYAFCPELRGRDFVVDRSQIDLSFKEVFNGLVAMTEAIANKQNQ